MVSGPPFLFRLGVDLVDEVGLVRDMLFGLFTLGLEMDWGACSVLMGLDICGDLRNLGAVISDLVGVDSGSLFSGVTSTIRPKPIITRAEISQTIKLEGVRIFILYLDTCFRTIKV